MLIYDLAPWAARHDLVRSADSLLDELGREVSCLRS